MAIAQNALFKTYWKFHRSFIVKRILYLSFYFEPDLCAGSFRNTPLVKELAQQIEDEAYIDLITTIPNRYSSFKIEAQEREEIGNLRIYRIDIPAHKSGFIDQIKSFYAYYQAALREVKGKDYDLIIASSSRLFTAYLGYRIAKTNKAPLFLDIRDIFVDTINDVLNSWLARKIILPFLKYIEHRTFSSASHINLISEGFKGYFSKYTKPNYTFFTNGIDEVFINAEKEYVNSNSPKTIVYAGNIGEGQGLHKFVPEAAMQLGEDFKFIIIGDGGAKSKLIQAVEERNLKNVEFRDPVSRSQLLIEYKKASYLLMHLNDYEAFKKVLPSKVFELATFPQPMIAGVGGYAHQFVKENVSNSILFQPGGVNHFLEQLRSSKYYRADRTEFIEKYKRDRINQRMAKSMKQYL